MFQFVPDLRRNKVLYFLLEEKEVDIKLAVAAGSMTTSLNVECSHLSFDTH